MSEYGTNSRMRKFVLIVDTDIECQKKIREALSGKNTICHKASGVKAALEMLSKRTYDLVLTELELPDRNGQELVKLIAEKSPSTQIIVLASSRDSRKVSNCIAMGAFNYLRKPLQSEQLKFLVETAFDTQPPESENLFLAEKGAYSTTDRLVGRSRAMQKVYKQIRLSASTDIHVLLTGESGTGKELVARSIHNQSDRCDGPFIAVNTGAIEPNLIASELFGHVKGAFTGARRGRKGMFEMAHGGTLFLDELSTMDEQVQISLLRVLDDKVITKVGGLREIKVDVRIIGATNASLEDEVKAGRIREDLYHRLNVFTIHVPSLRERKSDIKVLADFFVKQFSWKFDKMINGISHEALSLMRAYDWPGNIRELKNSIQRAVLLSADDNITPELLPDRLKPDAAANPEISLSVGGTLADAEKAFIAATLAYLNGNKKEAARVLGISRKSIYNKMKKYDL
ncbi:MAG: sigma-54-dependent Fis family transcriptional regulator [Candidatus Hydrogenedentota bacterium]|nr:MAG: sigma-54-dependent Fis family transcriptional regulator [Candidatus Hydrogenedentota bacterium]